MVRRTLCSALVAPLLLAGVARAQHQPGTVTCTKGGGRDARTYTVENDFIKFVVDAGMGGRKLVRDGEIYGSTPGSGSPPGSDMPVYVTDSLGGSFPSAVQYFDGDLTTPPGDVFLQNHDASYNILFVDGTVKTFGDGGRSIKKTLEDLARDAIPGSTNQPGSAVIEKIFMVYFDTLYIAD